MTETQVLIIGKQTSKLKQTNMIEQRIFSLNRMPMYQAVATVMDDGKVWVKYFFNYHEITEGIDNEDHLFAESVIHKITDWVNLNDYTLWSY
jgi:hypothetical protein